MEDHNMLIKERNSKNINIFRLLFDKRQFFGDGNIFDRYKFSFNSMVERLEKYNIPIERDLSRKSRRVIKEKPNAQIEHLSHFDSKEISFQDLLGVASGRYTSQYVYNRLYNEKAFEEQQFIEKEVDYEISNNKQTLIEREGDTKQEIREYTRLGYDIQEAHFNKLCENRKEQINKMLSKEEALHKNTIHDKKLHRQISQQISASLKQFVDCGPKYPKSRQQRNQVVEKNKALKRKHEIIKMRQLLETFFIKGEREQSIRDLVSKRR